MINSFRGKYYFLSNFYPSEILINGKKYPTVEHAFQAMKATNSKDMLWIASASTPKEAKKRGRSVAYRKDWEEVKLAIMEKLVYLKFIGNQNLLDLLVETGDEELIEGNWWGDTFWGVCNEVGENHLGKILMKIRDHLKRRKLEKYSLQKKLGLKRTSSLRRENR